MKVTTSTTLFCVQVPMRAPLRITFTGDTSLGLATFEIYLLAINEEMNSQYSEHLKIYPRMFVDEHRAYLLENKWCVPICRYVIVLV